MPLYTVVIEACRKGVTLMPLLTLSAMRIATGVVYLCCIGTLCNLIIFHPLSLLEH
jgi:hypothetical protein